MLDWAFEQTAQPVAIRIPTHGRTWYSYRK